MAQGTVGLFDSGVGGLTVAAEVFRMLPEQRVIYFGDTAHVPYGGRSVNELVTLADRIISFLCTQGARYIIFACNTSSAVSLQVLRDRYQVPMTGLIEPGAAEAVRVSTTGRIGVIATEATVRAGAYARAIKEISPDCEVFSKATPQLVPLVEAGEIDTPRAEGVLRAYLEPLKEIGIDTLILGCTHYPFLRRPIARILGTGVRLVDPAAATVRAAMLNIRRLGLLPGDRSHPKTGANSAGHLFYVSGPVGPFASVVRRFLGCEPGLVVQVNLDHKPKTTGG